MQLKITSVFIFIFALLMGSQNLLGAQASSNKLYHKAAINVPMRHRVLKSRISNKTKIRKAKPLAKALTKLKVQEKLVSVKKARVVQKAKIQKKAAIRKRIIKKIIKDSTEQFDNNLNSRFVLIKDDSHADLSKRHNLPVLSNDLRNNITMSDEVHNIRTLKGSVYQYNEGFSKNKKGKGSFYSNTFSMTNGSEEKYRSLKDRSGNSMQRSPSDGNYPNNNNRYNNGHNNSGNKLSQNGNYKNKKKDQNGQQSNGNEEYEEWNLLFKHLNLVLAITDIKLKLKYSPQEYGELGLGDIKPSINYNVVSHFGLDEYNATVKLALSLGGSTSFLRAVLFSMYGKLDENSYFFFSIHGVTNYFTSLQGNYSHLINKRITRMTPIHVKKHCSAGFLFNKGKNGLCNSMMALDTEIDNLRQMKGASGSLVKSFENGWVLGLQLAKILHKTPDIIIHKNVVLPQDSKSSANNEVYTTLQEEKYCHKASSLKLGGKIKTPNFAEPGEKPNINSTYLTDLCFELSGETSFYNSKYNSNLRTYNISFNVPISINISKNSSTAIRFGLKKSSSYMANPEHSKTGIIYEGKFLKDTLTTGEYKSFMESIYTSIFTIPLGLDYTFKKFTIKYSVDLKLWNNDNDLCLKWPKEGDILDKDFFAKKISASTLYKITRCFEGAGIQLHWKNPTKTRKFNMHFSEKSTTTFEENLNA